jgi:Prion-inhibition and propagation
MAEAVGLIVGGVGLASLFTTCIDCFEYVQLGRQFGTNYQRSLLKLDIVKLRLSRWADAVNDSQQHYNVAIGSTSEASKVQEILSEIIELFANAEKVSAKYKMKAKPGDLVAYNADADLEPDLRSMHNKMRELAIKRQKRSSFAQKAAWALYEEKHFHRLIEDVTTLVDGLVELFPATRGRLQQLSLEEAQEIEEEPCLVILEEATGDIDPLLQTSVQQALIGREGHIFTRNLATDDARVRYGDENVAGATLTGSRHTYDGNIALGKSRVHYGNKFGGKGVLDD